MGSLFGIRTGDGWATIVRPNIFCARGSEVWLNWSLAYVCDENYPAAEVDMEKQAAAIPRCCSPAAVHSGGVHLTSPSCALPIRLLHKMDSEKLWNRCFWDLRLFLSEFFMYHFSTDLGSVLHHTRVDTAASVLVGALQRFWFSTLVAVPSVFPIYHCLLWSHILTPHITHSSVPLRCVLWGQFLLLSLGLDENPGSPNGNFCVSYPCWPCRPIKIPASGQLSSR